MGERRFLLDMPTERNREKEAMESDWENGKRQFSDQKIFLDLPRSVRPIFVGKIFFQNPLKRSRIVLGTLQKERSPRSNALFERSWDQNGPAKRIKENQKLSGRLTVSYSFSSMPFRYTVSRIVVIYP